MNNYHFRKIIHRNKIKIFLFTGSYNARYMVRSIYSEPKENFKEYMEADISLNVQKISKVNNFSENIFRKNLEQTIFHFLIIK